VEEANRLEVEEERFREAGEELIQVVVEGRCSPRIVEAVQ